MRKWILALILLLPAIPAHADGMLSNKFLASGAGTSIDNIGTAITQHKLTWNVSGTASVCTVALDSSADGVTWSAGGVIAGQTCTSNGSTTITAATVNYVRINMTALTVTAGSSVTVTWNGYVNAPGGGGTIASCTTTGGVAFESGTANTLTCGPNLTYASSSLSVNQASASTPAIITTPTTNVTNTLAYIGSPRSAFSTTPAGFLPDGSSGFTSSTLTVANRNDVSGENFGPMAVVQENADVTLPTTGVGIYGFNTNTASKTSFDDALFVQMYQLNSGSSPLSGENGIHGAAIGALMQGSGSLNIVEAVESDTEVTSGSAVNAFGFRAESNTAGGPGAGGGTVTNLAAFRADVQDVATNVYGFYSDNQNLGTNNYNFYSNTQTMATNNWSFYDAATTNKDRFGVMTAATMGTETNCKANGTGANPSVVSCSAASAGMFSCATNASTGTCQVNTTAVTANSEILITQDAADGGAGQLNVTCNTTNVLSTTKPLLVSKSAGASFTINLGTVTANPACFEFHIIN